MKVVLNKKSIIEFLIIFILVIVFVGRLFPVNYPTDIYQIKLMGLKQYSLSYFLPSGRIIGIAYLYLLDSIGISIDLYIAITKVCAIVIASISIFLFYKMLVKHKENCGKVLHVLFFITSIAMFLSHATYQYFYYPESGIMWLSILFVIIAVRYALQKKYVKTWLFIFLAMNCYQAITYSFLPIFLLFYFTQTKNLKDTIIELFKNGLILVSNLVIGFIIVTIARNCFDFVVIEQATNITFDISVICAKMVHLGFEFNDGFPNIYISFFNEILLLFFIFSSKENFHTEKKSHLLYVFLLLILISFVEVLFTISILNFYNGARIQFAFAISPFLVFLLLMLNTAIEKYIKQQYILILLLLIITLYNFVNCYIMTKYHFIARDNSDYIGECIKSKVENYEKNTGNIITKIVYCNDLDSGSSMLDINIRKFTYEATVRSIWRMEYRKCSALLCWERTRNKRGSKHIQDKI